MLNKLASSRGFSLAISLYAAFVLQHLWNWFVVSAFNTGPISFWLMYGLSMFAAILTQQGDTSPQAELLWNRASVIMDACVPDDRREGLDKKLKEQSGDFWIGLGFNLVDKAVGLTLALVIGWGIHRALA